MSTLSVMRVTTLPYGKGHRAIRDRWDGRFGKRTLPHSWTGETSFFLEAAPSARPTVSDSSGDSSSSSGDPVE
eukprot:15444166-Alexandrium_andersonii.AAC.1